MKDSKTYNATKYFIAFFEKGTEAFQLYPEMMLLIDKAWIGTRVERMNVNKSQASMLLSRPISTSSDDDKLVWFESIEAAYEYISSERYNSAISKSNIDIELEWAILQGTSSINVITTRGDDDIDTVLAQKALDDLSKTLTPEQLSILKNLVP